MDCSPHNNQQMKSSPQTTIASHNNNLNSLRNRFIVDHDQERDFKNFGLTNNMKFRLFMSEFLGTFFLVYLSQAALTSFELLGTQNDIINRRLATILTYGLAYLSASLMTLNLSGAHLNPAYTFGCASFGNLRWGQALNYMIAQYFGSFLSAIFLHATYSDKLAQRHTEGLLTGMNSTLRAHGNILSTGKFFSSYPPTEVSLTQLNISYTLATAMLTCLIHMVYKSKLVRVPRSQRPVFLAAAHCLIQAAYSANGGPVFNPAQDFSPRLYIYLFGWGPAAFNLYNYKYWWVCGILAPHVGALIGFALYKILDHLRTIRDDDDDKSEDFREGMGGNDRLNRPCEHDYHHPAHNFMLSSRTTHDF